MARHQDEALFNGFELLIIHILLVCLLLQSINAMVETFPVTSPTFASIDQDHRDLGAAPDTADDWELPAVDDDSTINLLHTMLGHLPSGRFETRPDCRAFILELYRTRGFNLTLILGAKWPEEAKDCSCVLTYSYTHS